MGTTTWVEGVSGRQREVGACLWAIPAGLKCAERDAGRDAWVDTPVGDSQ
ncbi:MAG: hypothetical protein H6716_23600 [Polyangiaceae bacterium]|nr:hypothetical protein [Polyangiaceae bacterium]